MYRNLLFLIAFFVISTHAFANNTSKSVAMGMISSNSMSKISTQELHNLMDENIQDFIVEFDTASVPQNALAGLTKTQVMHTRSGMVKSSMRTMSTSDPSIDIMKDYSMLPMMAIKTVDRAALAKILNRPDVKAIYKNKRNEPNLQQSLPLVNQPQASVQGHIGLNTSIAILDTGVDYTHSTFGCTAPNTPAGCRVAFAQDFATEDNDRDDDGHGTNVAAIAASTAPGAKILALDVFPAGGGNAFDSDIIDAVNWAITNKFQYNIVSMNLSLGNNSSNNSVCQSPYTTPFSNARNIGIIPVVSSGNNSHKSGVSHPACAAGAVRVGAIYDANIGPQNRYGCLDSTTASDQVTCWSNSGSLLTILAPGTAITAGGNTYHGTSQASPHVAGAIAVLKANDVAPNDSTEQTINHLTNTGVNIVDNFNNITRPRVNLEAAINDAITPIGTPVALTPANGSTINDSTPAFTWTEVPTAPRYGVLVQDANGNTIFNQSTGTNIQCPGGTCSYTHPSATLSNGNYTWSVKVINPDNSNGPNSSTLSFTVNTGGSSNTTPVTLTPADGSTISDSTPAFTYFHLV